MVNTKVQQIFNKINKSSLRERALLAITLLAGIYFSWDILVFQNYVKHKKSASKQISNLENTVNIKNKQIEGINNILIQDPLADLRQREQEIRKRNKDTQEEMLKLTKTLIPPKDMVKLLQNILQKDKFITVTKLENLKPTPLFNNLDKSKKDNSKEQNTNEPQIYKHGMTIEFTANFFETKKFLQELEKMPWQILWDDLYYTVEEYPNAKVKLNISTLSTDLNWIGS